MIILISKIIGIVGICTSLGIIAFNSMKLQYCATILYYSSQPTLYRNYILSARLLPPPQGLGPYQLIDTCVFDRIIVWWPWSWLDRWFTSCFFILHRSLSRVLLNQIKCMWLTVEWHGVSPLLFIPVQFIPYVVQLSKIEIISLSIYLPCRLQ